MACYPRSVFRTKHIMSPAWLRACALGGVLALVACQRRQPNPFEHSGRYTHVAVGDGSTCVTDGAGDVTCWGNHRPKHASELPAGPYTQLSVGSYSHCGLRTDGTLACAGRPGGAARTAVPAPIAPPGTFVALAGQCGLRHDGSVACATGRSASTRLAAASIPPGPFTRIAVGAFGGCGVTRSGELNCWGVLSPNTTAACRTGLKMVDLTPPANIQGEVIDVAMGAVHSCALLRTGQVRCWGDDACGQLAAPPSAMGQLASHPTANRTCGLTTLGAIECWGEALTPTPAPTGSFASLSVGRAHACALRPGGDVVCWGQNAQDQVAGNRSRLGTYLFHN